MLTRNHRQEALTRAYIQTIAARAGCSCSFRDFDYGIDITLHDLLRRGRRYTESGFKLDIQAKSLGTAGVLPNAPILYDLDLKNYDDLRNPHVGCPRILVVLVLPDDESEWTVQSEENLVLRRAAYWLSLKGFEPSTNRRSVRLAIPRENLLTLSALQALMQRVRRRQPL